MFNFIILSFENLYMHNVLFSICWYPKILFTNYVFPNYYHPETIILYTNYELMYEQFDHFIYFLFLRVTEEQIINCH
jgi:hypothetical protein